MYDGMIFPGQYHPSLGHYLWINILHCAVREKNLPGSTKAARKRAWDFSDPTRGICMTQRGELILTSLGCKRKSVLCTGSCLSDLSVEERGNCTDGVLGRLNDRDWRGWRDWNGDHAWPIIPHLESIDVALKFQQHVKSCGGTFGAVVQILTEKDDPALRMREQNSHVGFNQWLTDNWACW